MADILLLREISVFFLKHALSDNFFRCIYLNSTQVCVKINSSELAFFVVLTNTFKNKPYLLRSPKGRTHQIFSDVLSVTFKYSTQLFELKQLRSLRHFGVKSTVNFTIYI